MVNLLEIKALEMSAEESVCLGDELFESFSVASSDECLSMSIFLLALYPGGDACCALWMFRVALKEW